MANRFHHQLYAVFLFALLAPLRACVAAQCALAEQRNALLAMGCSHYQGYLFGRPAPLTPESEA